MESIARFFVASADLIEAEGRAFKRQFGRLLLAVAVAVVAVAMVIAGLGFVLFGLFAFLARVVGGPSAALIFGVIALSLAAAAAVTIRKLFA